MRFQWAPTTKVTNKALVQHIAVWLFCVGLLGKGEPTQVPSTVLSWSPSQALVVATQASVETGMSEKEETAVVKAGRFFQQVKTWKCSLKAVGTLLLVLTTLCCHQRQKFLNLMCRNDGLTRYAPLQRIEEEDSLSRIDNTAFAPNANTVSDSFSKPGDQGKCPLNASRCPGLSSRISVSHHHPKFRRHCTAQCSLQPVRGPVIPDDCLQEITTMERILKTAHDISRVVQRVEAFVNLASQLDRALTSGVVPAEWACNSAPMAAAAATTKVFEATRYADIRRRRKMEEAKAAPTTVSGVTRYADIRQRRKVEAKAAPTNVCGVTRYADIRRGRTMEVAKAAPTTVCGVTRYADIRRRRKVAETKAAATMGTEDKVEW